MDKYLLVYYSCIVAGFFIACICAVSVRKRRDFLVKEAVLFSLFEFCASLFGAMLMAQLYNIVVLAASDATVQAASRLRLFGVMLFSPFVLKFFYSAAKKDAKAQLDIYSPCTVLALGCAKVGCFFYGCCYGIETANGVTNRLTGLCVVPVQLIEALFCFALALFLMILLHRKKCVGLLFPIAQIAYSVPRFFLEFLRRYDFAVEGDIFLNLSVWQLFAILTTLIGSVWLTSSLVCRRKTIRL